MREWKGSEEDGGDLGRREILFGKFAMGEGADVQSGVGRDSRWGEAPKCSMGEAPELGGREVTETR